MRHAPYGAGFRQSVGEMKKLAQSNDLLMPSFPGNSGATINSMIAQGKVRPEIPMGTWVHAYLRFLCGRYVMP